MSPKKKYWLFLILFWGLYCVIGGTIAAANTGWRGDVILGFVLFFFYSIGFSDLLRRLAERLGLRGRVSFRNVAGIIALIMVVSAVETSLVVGVDRALSGFKAESAWPFVAVFWTWWGTGWSTGGWYGMHCAATNRRRRREKEARLELALKEAELRALEAQIHPHFLFNCLNSIRGLVAEDPKLAQDMITRFASILRYNLSHDPRHTVPLAEEADVVSDYLALERMRFEDRLRVHLSVDADAGKIPVPPMLLQSLVENALKHGIGKLPEGGEIRIHAEAGADALVLEVENTGQLAAAKPGDTQIGLNNIRERLRLLYGDGADIQLRNRNGDCVAATVRIPRLSPA